MGTPSCMNIQQTFEELSCCKLRNENPNAFANDPACVNPGGPPPGPKAGPAHVEALVRNQVSTSGFGSLVMYYEREGYKNVTQFIGSLHGDGVTPIDTNSLVEYQGATKGLVAMVVGMLADAGHVKFSDPLASWIPEFAQIVDGKQLTPNGDSFKRIDIIDESEFFHAYQTVHQHSADLSNVDPVTQRMSFTDPSFNVTYVYVAKHSSWFRRAFWGVTPGPDEDYTNLFFKLVPDYATTRVIDVITARTGFSSAYYAYEWHDGSITDSLFPKQSKREVYAHAMALDSLKFPAYNAGLYDSVATYDYYMDDFTFATKDINGTFDWSQDFKHASIVTVKEKINYLTTNAPYILHSPGESRRYSLDFLFAGELIRNVVNSLDESTRTSYGFTGTIEDGGEAIYTMLLRHLVGGTEPSTFVSGMSYAHPASSYAQTLDNHHIDRLQPWSGNYAKSMARTAARQWAMMPSDFQGGFGIWTSVATFIDYAKFLKNLGRTSNGKQLLSKETFLYLTTGEFSAPVSFETRMRGLSKIYSNQFGPDRYTGSFTHIEKYDYTMGLSNTRTNPFLPRVFQNGATYCLGAHGVMIWWTDTELFASATHSQFAANSFAVDVLNVVLKEYDEHAYAEPEPSAS